MNLTLTDFDKVELFFAELSNLLLDFLKSEYWLDVCSVVFVVCVSMFSRKARNDLQKW